MTTTNVTIIKGMRPSARVSLSTIEDLYKSIKNNDYGDSLVEYRLSFPYDANYNDNDREYKSKLYVSKKVPSVCFSGLCCKQDSEKTLTGRNPLVLIEVENLINFQFAAQLRAKAATLPYTCLTFIGTDGRSVKIVCRVVKIDGCLPATEEEWQKFIGKAYDKAHFIYSSFLNVDIPKRMPDMERTCLVSADAGCFFDPNSEPLRIDINSDIVTDYELPVVADFDKESLSPGMSQLEAQRTIFYTCLKKAFNDAADGEDKAIEALNLLAAMCHDSGLPMIMCANLCRYYYAFRNLGNTIDSVFDAVYERDLRNVTPLKHIPQSMLLSYKTEYFLKTHYMLRKNVLSGVVQYKEMIAFAGDWRILDDEVRNTMTINAQKHGLNMWDKDMNRYIKSTKIPKYNPIDDFIYGLDKWDGKDNVTEFARRIPTSNPNWAHDFHVWMLAMVAHWMNLDSQHGNAAMPLLIGGQGTGKTSFCRIILPPELRLYYTDKIDLKNENTVNAAMSGYALINIDEFDNLTRSSQPRLKMLISTATVDSREMYKSSMSRKRRYASFIGSTNNLHPILDYTGCRRFICVPVEGMIDFATPVDYNKLYAQLVSELRDGARYYFDDADNQRIMAYNKRFRNITDTKDMIAEVFRVPRDGEEGEVWSISQISDKLKSAFTNYSQAKNFNTILGKLLTESGFERKRMRTGSYYVVALVR